MKKSRQLITYLLFAAVVIGVIGAAYLLSQQPIKAGTNIMYPLMSSVCCQADGPDAWAPETVTLQKYGQTFSCPRGTTSCRVKTPTFDCSGGAWLGYEELWKIDLYENGIPTHTYCSHSYCEKITSSDGKQFKPGDYVVYRGGCLDNAVIYSGIDDGLSKSQSDSVMIHRASFIDHIKTQLWKYPAGEGQFNIPNTPLCVQNNEVRDYAENTPKDTSLVGSLTTAVNQLLGVSSNTGKTDAGYLVDQNQLTPGQCYRAVDRWEAIPSYLNMDPMGQYNNKHVICSQDKGLFELTYVETEDGDAYYVPYSRLPTPSDFCCSNAHCQNDPTFGSDSGCVNYQCKKGSGGQCQADINCQTGADPSCFVSGSKFYTRAGRCVNHQCINQDTEVKCCPNYCVSQGMWCDYDVGCKPSSCTYHSAQVCREGDIFWVDSCGNKQDLVKDCPKGCDPNTNKCLEDGGGSCEAKCSIDLFGIKITDYLCYVACVIENAAKGVVEFTVTLMKLVADVLLSVFVGLIVYQQATKGRKNKGKTAEALLSVVAAFLASYLLWIIFGMV